MWKPEQKKQNSKIWMTSQDENFWLPVDYQLYILILSFRTEAHTELRWIAIIFLSNAEHTYIVRRAELIVLAPLQVTLSLPTLLVFTPSEWQLYHLEKICNRNVCTKLFWFCQKIRYIMYKTNLHFINILLDILLQQYSELSFRSDYNKQDHSTLSSV